MKEEEEKLYTVESEDDVFKAAWDYVKSKVVVSHDDYKKLKEKYKALAFSVARYTEIEVLKQFKEKLLEALEQGTTVEQFRQDMNTFLADKGFTGITPYKADMIFRQNIQTAYSAGHYESMTDKAVLRERPYWQYQTAGDGDVRASHAAMDGKVYRADDPIWKTWYPPNGFGCRCIVVSLTEAQVKQRGLEVENELPEVLDMKTGALDKVLPDEGFRINPAKQEFKPNMKDYPKALKKAFEEALKEADN